MAGTERSIEFINLRERDVYYTFKASMLTFLAHVSSESILACTDVSPITVVIAAPSILTRVGQARLYAENRPKSATLNFTKQYCFKKKNCYIVISLKVFRKIAA